MKIVEGSYEMGVSHGKVIPGGEVIAKLIMPAGSTYEMTNPEGWHYVRPLGEKSLSVMVTGKPWSSSSSKNTKSLSKLSDKTVIELLEVFSKYYN